MCTLFRLLVVIRRWIMNQNSKIMGFPSQQNNNCISMQRRFLITFLTIIIFSPLPYAAYVHLNASELQEEINNRKMKNSPPSSFVRSFRRFICARLEHSFRGCYRCAPPEQWTHSIWQRPTEDNFPSCRLLVNTFKELRSNDKERVQISFFELASFPLFMQTLNSSTSHLHESYASRFVYSEREIAADDIYRNQFRIAVENDTQQQQQQRTIEHYVAWKRHLLARGW